MKISGPVSWYSFRSSNLVDHTETYYQFFGEVHDPTLVRPCKRGMPFQTYLERLFEEAAEAGEMVDVYIEKWFTACPTEDEPDGLRTLIDTALYLLNPCILTEICRFPTVRAFYTDLRSVETCALSSGSGKSKFLPYSNGIGFISEEINALRKLLPDGTVKRKSRKLRDQVERIRQAIQTHLFEAYRYETELNQLFTGTYTGDLYTDVLPELVGLIETHGVGPDHRLSRKLLGNPVLPALQTFFFQRYEELFRDLTDLLTLYRPLADQAFTLQTYQLWKEIQIVLVKLDEIRFDLFVLASIFSFNKSDRKTRRPATVVTVTGRMHSQTFADFFRFLEIEELGAYDLYKDEADPRRQVTPGLSACVPVTEDL